MDIKLNRKNIKKAYYSMFQINKGSSCFQSSDADKLVWHCKLVFLRLMLFLESRLNDSLEEKLFFIGLSHLK